MTGRSLLGVLTGEDFTARDEVFLERERHANVRAGDLSYPSRAIRTKEFLFIENLRPNRWPAGDPQMWKAVGPFGDIDGSPSKDLLLARRDDSAIRPFFERACGMRPEAELYDVTKDPWQLTNVANDSRYTAVRRKFEAMLLRWRIETGDPRAMADGDRFDRYPYFGREPAAKPK